MQLFKHSLESLLNRQKYQNLNLITLSKSALTQNYQYLSSLKSGTQVAPVIKSNAYGHGILEIASILDKVDCPFLCVDSLFEAYQLYKHKIHTPILVMGYINPENLKVKRLPFSYAVYDQTLLSVLNKYQKGAKIHIKIDTGMHRLGVPMGELDEFLSKVKDYKNITVEGLMTHLAESDPTSTQTKLQIENFASAIKLASFHNIYPKYIHAAASAGLLHLEIPGTNVARVGIALYGIDPTDKNLTQVLSFISHIAQIKTISPGDSVGYDATFVAKNPMTIGIVPAGYNDGVDRRLSNVGKVLVDDVECQILGRVSMNMTAIDLSVVQSPILNQTVTIFSENPNNGNSIAHAAKLASTIPHDLLVHLHPSTKRVIVD